MFRAQASLTRLSNNIGLYNSHAHVFSTRKVTNVDPKKEKHDRAKASRDARLQAKLDYHHRVLHGQGMPVKDAVELAEKHTVLRREKLELPAMMRKRVVDPGRVQHGEIVQDPGRVRKFSEKVDGSAHVHILGSSNVSNTDAVTKIIDAPTTIRSAGVSTNIETKKETNKQLIEKYRLAHERARQISEVTMLYRSVMCRKTSKAFDSKPSVRNNGDKSQYSTCLRCFSSTSINNTNTANYLTNTLGFTKQESERLVPPSTLWNRDSITLSWVDLFGRSLGKVLDSDTVLRKVDPADRQVLDQVWAHQRKSLLRPQAYKQETLQRTDLPRLDVHACKYLWECDLKMNPREGFSKGTGDYKLSADWSSLRHIVSPKSEFSFLHCEQQQEALHPRDVLRRIMDELRDMNLSVGQAGEIEFYLTDSNNRPVPDYPCDYHQFPDSHTQYQGIMQRLRNAGVPVEGCKGEAGRGQHEVNIKWRRGMDAVDDLQVSKMILEQWAKDENLSIDFSAKPDTTQPGSGLHLHLHLDYAEKDSSVWENLFYDANTDSGVKYQESIGLKPKTAPVFHFVAGVQQYLGELSPLWLPNKNSYQRLAQSNWCPTTMNWGLDDRSVAVRVIESSHRSARVEVRLAGMDANPYLLAASVLKCGQAGQKESLLPPPQTISQTDTGIFAKSLAEGVQMMQHSQVAKSQLGTSHDHYVQFYTLESQ